MGDGRKKILAVSGSTRTHSANETILRVVADLYKETLDVQIFKGIGDLPHFNPDLDHENVAASVRDFRKLIEDADGVIVCTPEYVFSLPGALKNSIEWTVSTTVFSDKPLAIIVASGLGEKAYESLILIMKTVGAKIGEHSTLLIKGARSKVNDQGQITDQRTMEEIRKVMLSFEESLNLITT